MFVIHIQTLPTVKLLSEITLCLRMMNMGMKGFYAINSLFDISRTQIKYKMSTVSLRLTPLCVFELLLCSHTYVTETNSCSFITRCRKCDVEIVLMKLEWQSSFSGAHYHLQIIQLSPLYLKSLK